MKLFFAALAFTWTFQLAAQTEYYEVVDVRIEGADRTKEDWIFDFLVLKTPSALTEEDCAILAMKLMTTNVFASVKFRLENANDHPGGHILIFEIEEKWTTIPVVRGAMGGGTPLRVFGIYDTHVSGRLWTLGAETRKYGDAPNGFITWARAPRWKDGRYYLSAELWNIPRVRFLFDDKDRIVGNLQTDTRFLRLEHLRPLDRLNSITERGNWKYGVRLDVKSSRADKYKNLEEGKRIAELKETDEITRELHVLPKFEYDNIFQSNLEMDGIRFIAGSGFIIDDGDFYNHSEFELFYFKRLWKSLYSAFHIDMKSTDNKRSNNIFYLGGLDSVRGHPDGAMFGNRSVYSNLELRFPGLRTRHIHVQNIVFYDSGSAAFEWNDMAKSQRSAVGVGIRIGTPLVYRLVLRIDYAWSTDSKNQGLSIGLNQFFQPYKPL